MQYIVCARGMTVHSHGPVLANPGNGPWVGEGGGDDWPVYGTADPAQDSALWERMNARSGNVACETKGGSTEEQ